MTRDVAVVTGAAGGLGLPLITLLAKRGSLVIGTDVDEAAIDSARSLTEGLPVVWHQLDVTDSDRVDEVFEIVRVDHGGCSVLVNNAIRACPIPRPFVDTGLDQWRLDYSIIVEGAVNCSRGALRHMLAAGRGSIVNVSSVNAVGFYGHPTYSAAKAALLSLTRSIAVQYAGSGIRCNTVLPGTIKTPAWAEQVAADPSTFDALRTWYPAGDVAEPGEVAEVIAFLAHERSSIINGATIVADGGLTAGNLPMSRFVEGDPEKSHVSASGT